MYLLFYLDKLFIDGIIIICSCYLDSLELTSTIKTYFKNTVNMILVWNLR